ncbi:MAG: CZB domain-containing protein [Deltaproteobacteria bacterium]|nr:CZB domain-containing protein [Deltaproteobacteria bacterium]
MDFSAAIVAHTRWKYRLVDYVEGRSAEKLDADAIACDDRCDLGKWIHASRALEASKTFVELRTEHAAFHTCAAEVVRTRQAGRVDDARKLLEITSPYVVHSTAVVTLIKKLSEQIR